MKITDAPSAGELMGTVVDENGAHIAGATIAAASATTTTDANGAFSLAPPPGRVALTASAPGRVSVMRSIGVTSRSPFVSVMLVPQPTAQTISAAGGSVTVGAASIDCPAGAFRSGAQLSAAWIDRAHISAASGAPLFVDEHGLHRLVGQLHVEVSTEPVVPVSVRVIVAAGTATPVLYAVEAGEHTARIEASSVVAGVATFPVTHFSDYHVLLERSVNAAVTEEDKILDAAWVLIAAEGAAVYDAVGRAFKSGDDVPSKTTLSGGRFSIWAPNDAEVSCAATPITFITNDDGTTSVSCEGCAVQASVAKRFIGPVRKFFIRTKTAVMGVRGTVFSVLQERCAQGDGSAIDTVEVSEGDVDFAVGAEDFDVPAGKRAKGCEGCKDAKQAVCDCDVDACEAAGGECNPCTRGVQINEPLLLLGGLSNCIEKGAVCCPFGDGSQAALCKPSTGLRVCQCKGKPYAECASANSVCDEDRPPLPSGVTDCGTAETGYRGTARVPQPGATLCREDLGQRGRGYLCIDPTGYTHDPYSCGGCGIACAAPDDGTKSRCFNGKCLNCLSTQFVCDDGSGELLYGIPPVCCENGQLCEPVGPEGGARCVNPP